MDLVPFPLRSFLPLVNFSLLFFHAYSQQWYVKLALKLLWERQLGSASTVEGYVKVLPAQGSFETLIHWTDQVGRSIVL